ncbi:MAG: hypothetical protein HUU46_03645 [Candidatus Hydrogenedentes bacterium]|nr:hypothetical protein [Candidatus Hydrogenedentota bacterium]
MSHEKKKHWRTRDKVLGVIVGGLSFAAVVLVAWWESQERISPGDIHPSHIGIARLRGNDGCIQCHGDEHVSMDHACNACHKDIEEQRARTVGLHGRLAPEQLRECKACHVEHTGGEVALVTTESFTEAGATSSGSFDHSRLASYVLTGAHATLACGKCHSLSGAPELKEGEKRYLGLSQACTACHEDVHKGTFSADCASCHGQEKAFDIVAAFDHTKAFPLAGGHAGLKCSECHEADGDRSVAALMAVQGGVARGCGECHESPHRPSFIAAIAAERRSSEAETCAACHNAEHQTFLAPSATLTVVQHAATGFSLAAPHEKVECAACHKSYGQREAPDAAADARQRFLEIYPGRAQRDCRQCHEDPHKGGFNAGFSKGECAQCHELTHFVPSGMTPAVHAKTRFALSGAHGRIACDACHDTARGIDRFIPTPTECRACHDDIHKGRFGAAGPAADCAKCHTTERFDAVKWSAADHVAWTGYALEGGHGTASCADCHKPGQPYAEKFASTPKECAACHDDVHRGIFAAAKAATGKSDCARCHTTADFAGVRWTQQDHATWTGYALEGGHARVDCAQCHPPSTTTGFANRRFGVASKACATCHRDVHAGQFAVDGTNDCARCHSIAQPFRKSIFNHEQDSRFPLDAQHGKLDCGECHQPFRLDDGGSAIRYRPLGFKCQDCHNFTEPVGGAPK